MESEVSLEMTFWSLKMAGDLNFQESFAVWSSRIGNCSLLIWHQFMCLPHSSHFSSCTQMFCRSKSSNKVAFGKGERDELTPKSARGGVSTSQTFLRHLKNWASSLEAFFFSLSVTYCVRRKCSRMYIALAPCLSLLSRNRIFLNNRKCVLSLSYSFCYLLLRGLQYIINWNSRRNEVWWQILQGSVFTHLFFGINLSNNRETAKFFKHLLHVPGLLIICQE